MELLHRGLGAVRHGRQRDLGVQVQEGGEGEPRRVDVLQLVDDVTDGLLDAVDLCPVLRVSGRTPRGAHGRTVCRCEDDLVFGFIEYDNK